MSVTTLRSGTQFLWAWETRIDALTLQFGDRFAVEPGFQIYSQPGKIGQFSSWNDQDNRIGPQLFGKLFDIGPRHLGMERRFPGRPDQCRAEVHAAMAVRIRNPLLTERPRTEGRLLALCCDKGNAT